MQFKKYISIENSYRDAFIERVRETLEYFKCPNQLFSLSEKVDGCNTSVVTDGKSIIPGKRTSVLTEDEKFYNFQSFAEGMKNMCFGVFEDIKVAYPTVEYIQIFGEFFGGSYKGIPNNPKFSKIQKGIDYCPDHNFYGFDIEITTTDGTSKYLDVDECSELFEKHGFFYNKELFRGTLDECLAFSPIFISTIGTRLGLPPIEGNFAEGVVIKPINELRFANGERIIIKNKNPKFNEFEKDANDKPKKEVSDAFKSFEKIVEQYMTEARIHNVLSHIGELELPKQMGVLLKAYNEDLIEELVKDHPEFNDLENDEKKSINKKVNAFVVSFVKKNF